jgi:hypothetical protein
MSTALDPGRRANRSVAASIAVPVALVAVAALVGWLLLLLVKGLVVVLCYAVGAALVVVPLLMARRLLAGHDGRARWRRIGDLLTAVVIGLALIVTGYYVGRHGWLLIAVPAGLIAVSRIASRIGELREGHRAKRAVRN